LEDKKLIRRTISLIDRRERVVRLTPNGHRLLSRIEARSNKRVLGMVRHLDDEQLTELLDSMNTIRSLITTQEIHGQSD
jgi:DNA-binding MarR family transcriptional regulator